MLEDVRALPIDLDGVLDVAQEPIAGVAGAARARLPARRPDHERASQTRLQRAPGAHRSRRRVIIGDLGPAFGDDVLNHAFRQVMDAAELIAPQKNRDRMRADGLSLDVGPFLAAIEFAAGRDAYVIGKPAKVFFEQVLASVGVDASAAAIVGDDIESDIGGALRAGLDAILVRTGKYREARVRASTIQPTRVVDSIADAPALPGT
jgi:HAD superfamily hydrolase (TIGR01458 family)